MKPQPAAPAAEKSRPRGEASIVQEIHHRVKNNLQTVASLLRLQLRRTESVFAKEALADAANRVAGMAVVHEMLSGSPEPYADLRAMADRLVKLALQTALLPGQTVTCTVEGPDLRLSSDAASPLALVLHEMVTNSLKHGFRGGRSGALQVRWTSKGNEAELVVEDDGYGPPDGFSVEGSGHLGLQIAKSLAEHELRGRLECTALNPGFRAVVTCVSYCEGI